MNVLQQNYTISHDWDGTKYAGIWLDWDYENREVHLSIPGYVQRALTRFQHEAPQRPQHSPHPHTPPNYGQKVQYAKEVDTSQKLDKKDKKFIQEVTGVFLFYARAVDNTMLVALSAIASEQAEPTVNTMIKTKHFLDYAATHPDAVLTFRASDMVLAVHSDASYLNELGARSRAGGHYFLTEDKPFPPINGAITNVATIIKAVMASAAEAELGALFINSQKAVPIRQTLEELGHTQPPTPMQTDNSTAFGVVNNKILPKATKPMDMRFHWLRDRLRQKQFRYYWRPGTKNYGDYWTKHHPASHHQAMRPELLTSNAVVMALRKVAKNKMAASAA